MFHGVLDDFVPIHPRREFVDRLKAANQDVILSDALLRSMNFDVAKEARAPQASQEYPCREYLNPDAIGAAFRGVIDPFCACESKVSRGALRVFFRSRVAGEPSRPKRRLNIVRSWKGAYHQQQWRLARRRILSSRSRPSY